jgi:hypothetical protein
LVWEVFGRMAYRARLPCDAAQIGHCRRLLGEAGVEQWLGPQSKSRRQQGGKVAQLV